MVDYVVTYILAEYEPRRLSLPHRKGRHTHRFRATARNIAPQKHNLASHTTRPLQSRSAFTPPTGREDVAIWPSIYKVTVSLIIGRAGELRVDVNHRLSDLNVGNRGSYLVNFLLAPCTLSPSGGDQVKLRSCQSCPIAGGPNVLSGRGHRARAAASVSSRLAKQTHISLLVG